MTSWPPSTRGVTAYATPSLPPGTERTLRAIETTAVRDALAACNGNVTQAAKMLGVSRTKLYRDMKKG